MRKSAYLNAATLVAAGLVSLFSLFSPQVQARSSEADTLVEVDLKKGDRLDIQLLGTDCSQREWPYFEAACLRNAGDRTTPARLPRVISVDHVPSPRDADGMVAAR